MLSSLVLLCFFSSVVFHLVLSEVKKDEILDLPGLTTKPTFRQFSGYLRANEKRRLHYWFVESQSNPSKDPLILWLGGGPGCSAVGGYLEGHGPYLISEDGKTLKENQYSWNKMASIIYLESPAGVGFSYATDKNYTTSDDQTSLDNYWAIKTFLKLYPEYSQNDFYIMGGSYAGIYVPTLSVRIANDKSFNFKGFAIGNGATNTDVKLDSIVYFTYYHGLMSQREWLSKVASCCPGSNTTDGNCPFFSSTSEGCKKTVTGFFDALKDVNIYSIYKKCLGGPVDPDRWLLQIDSVGHRKILESKPNMKVDPPCVNSTAITTYLRNARVKKALHIPKAVPDWEICRRLNYTKQYDKIGEVYKNILQRKKYRIMLYTGDTDIVCNFLGVEWFVNSLSLKLKEEQKPWFYRANDGSQQIAGFVQKFENLTSLTVKGSGHGVAGEKPLQAFELFKNFLSGIF